MTLMLHATGAYRADVGTKWRTEDFGVRNLVKSLKGESFKGYSDISFGGKSHRISAADGTPAYAVWADWAVARLRELKLGKVSLVPVPASIQTKYGQNTCPVRMVTALAVLDPKVAVAGNFLKYRTAQLKAHSEGGTRDADEIEQALDCNVTDLSLPAVLIDDVMATGGHLKACARVLRSNGLKVEHVLVAGKTVWEAVDNPYVVEPVDIEAGEDFNF